VAEFGGKKITATIALTQMLRLQQIVGGFLPPIPPEELTDPDAVLRWREEHVDEAIPIPGPNPKLNELLDLLEEVDGKVIIWSRFRPEIALIAKGLRDKFGAGAVGEFHGGISTTERTRYRLAFQDPANRLRFIVGQTETGGLGITLSEAIGTVYFSNSFSLESRLQSEDRQVGKYGGTYWDLVARATVDMKVLDTLRSNKNVADMVTGDDISNWI
jgi:SNF2 family DNA or RNA helicase